MRFRGGVGRLFVGALALSAAMSFSAGAFAKVKRSGTWPSNETKVSLDVSRVPRDQAIQALAKAAGWSVVVHAPQADLVDVHVKDQPADKVLELLLLDADYSVSRDGTLVSIVRESGGEPSKQGNSGAATPVVTVPTIPPASVPVPPVMPTPPNGGVAPSVPTPPTPPEPPAVPSVAAVPEVPAVPAVPNAPSAAANADDDGPPAENGKDREFFGGSATIPKDEVVNDVAVMGGSLDVYGKVTGDIAVTGGSVRIHPGARVYGDVSVMGGGVNVSDGGRIDGDVDVVGGTVTRGDKAVIGGDVHGRNGKSKKSDSDDDDSLAGREKVRDTAAEVGGAFARAALLFVLGTVLLALAPQRMDALKAELVAHPMRSFAKGIVGFLAACALFLVLCVTVVGIPFALIGATVAVVAVFGSMCAVLETAGRALVKHKSDNPYVHLAVGTLLFLGATALPVIGPLVGFTVAFLAVGVLVSTRAAGLIQKKNGGAQPYRSAPV
ncbi:MAG: polymer-forming cytoskeletal protein [Polyangiaceae bacterium]|nr:polymer-forming cytoskeletal protein [Polyangiaceae bacterium]